MIRTSPWRAAVPGFTLALAAAAVLSACHENPTATTNQDDPPSLLAATDGVVLAAMEEAIRDEYRAETTYQTVLDAWGPVRPFINILGAEVRHSEALATLFQRRGLPVPGNDWTAEEVPVFGSLVEACRTGVEAEIENAAIYDAYLGLDLPPDVRQVFQSNRDASVDNHLPAFQRCS